MPPVVAQSAHSTEPCATSLTASDGRAVVCGATGDNAPAPACPAAPPSFVSYWAATVAAWRTANRPYQLSYALTRLAEADAASGDRDRAASALREAHAIAERLGAAPTAPTAPDAAVIARRAHLFAVTAERADTDRG